MSAVILETIDAKGNRQTEYSFTPGDVFEGSLVKSFRSDWIAVDVIKDSAYVFELEGIGETPLQDFELNFFTRRSTFLTPDSTVSEFDDEGFVTTKVTSSLVAQFTGTIYADIGSFSFEDGGDYRLSLDLAPGEDGDAAADASTLAELTVGDAFFGALSDAEDEDWLAVSLEADTTYMFSVTGSSLVDPTMALISPEGDTVFEADDGGFSVVSLDPQRAFTVDTAGTYYLAIDGATDVDIGAYQVLVQESSTTSSAGADRILLSGDDTFLFAGSGDDTVIGTAKDDTLYGEDGDDRLEGKARRDFLDGGLGDDLLLGNQGSDTLNGGEGNDTMRGGVRDDFFEGSRGIDVMVGGRGADNFSFFFAFDETTIRDFDVTEDSLLVGQDVFGGKFLSTEQVLDRSLSFEDGDAILDFKFGRLILEGVDTRDEVEIAFNAF